MFSPPARKFSIANQLVGEYDLNMEQTLELYLKLGFSLNDAAVSTWKYKYEYMVMRPNVYIHEFIDPDFQTNLQPPPVYSLIFLVTKQSLPTDRMREEKNLKVRPEAIQALKKWRKRMLSQEFHWECTFEWTVRKG